MSQNKTQPGVEIVRHLSFVPGVDVTKRGKAVAHVNSDGHESLGHTIVRNRTNVCGLPPSYYADVTRG